MRVLLINPCEEEAEKKDRIHFPSLALDAVASSFPSNVDIKIIDEAIDEVPFKEDFDLVGISINMSCKAPHSYKLAEKLREEGKKVILGGIHTSILPGESIKHADSVVIGEVENLGENIIRDLEKGELQKQYYSPYPDLRDTKRKFFFNKKERNKRYYVPNLIETSRGCPNNCSFCSVTQQYGSKYRTKFISNVLKEIEEGDMKGEPVTFVDNNITGSPIDYERAKIFFSELIPYDIKWFGQFDTRIGKDMELIKIMGKSGCKAAFVGFESLSAEGLKSVRKKWNLQDNFSSLCDKLHKHGIGIIGSFILGLDSDTPEVFSANVEFAKRNGLEAILFTKLTPLPGTHLFNEMREKKRLLYCDSEYPEAWKYHDGEHTVFKPKKMTVQELDEGFKWAYKEFYGSEKIPPLLAIIKRSLRYLKLYVPLNLAFWSYSRKIYEEGKKEGKTRLKQELNV